MYGTIVGWRAYALERGDSAPTEASDADATAALVRASDYIQWTYVERFRGGCVTSDEAIEQATYEAANLELATPGFWSTTFSNDQAKVLTGVDTIKWTPIAIDSKTDTGRAADAVRPVSTKIDAMLSKCMPSVRVGVGLRTLNAQRC
jgi:hypothetical protein